MARIDKRLAKITEREAELNRLIVEQAQDYTKVAELSAELTALATEREGLELEWLKSSELLD